MSNFYGVPECKKKMSKKISVDVAKYLESGKKIQKVIDVKHKRRKKTTKKE